MLTSGPKWLPRKSQKSGEFCMQYGVCIPRIFHLILQETIYGSISDGGRKTVCISETALIYALTLMFNVLKRLIAGFSVLCRGWTLYTSQANKISSKFKSPPLSDHDHWTLGAIRAMSDPFPPTSQISNQTRDKCSLLCRSQKFSCAIWIPEVFSQTPFSCFVYF